MDAKTSSLRINADRVHSRLARMAQVGRQAEGGVMRLAYSEADKEACALAMSWMREAKLEPTIDAGANVVGRRAAADSGRAPLVLGSHVDSVPAGGDYDGPLGVIAAIEAAEVLAEHAILTRHPLEVVSWSNEEGGLYGSRAVSGQVSAHELSNVAESGKTIGDGIAFLGGDPSRLAAARRPRGAIAAYLELHIEQGATLEEAHIDVGVVEGIVGIFRGEVTIRGVANHAGTTPMDRRHDAVLAAGRFIDMVNRVVTSVSGQQRGTVGRLVTHPNGGAPNLISGLVNCSVELRDMNPAKIKELYERIQKEALAIGVATGTSFDFHPLHDNVPAPCDPRVQAAIADSAAALGLSTRTMPSGAGHDAQSMATIGPAGMIFIPSQGGISHSPKEYSSPRDVVNGANVMLQTLLRLDTTLE